MNKELSNSELISLLEIYEEEWRFRNTIWYSRMFKFSIVSLVTSLLPYLDQYFSVQLPDISKKGFPIAGLALALFSLIFSLMYARRIEAASDTIKKINYCLDERYQMERIGETGIDKLLRRRICYALSIAIFAFEAAIALFVILSV